MSSFSPEGLLSFKEQLVEAARRLSSYEPKWVKIIFHDDADGVTAASITYKAIQHLGLEAELICLEKAFPEALELIQAGEGGLILYVDIGSAHAELIARLNEDRNLTLILDHHDAVPSPSHLVLNLNPELHGVSGETYASGATVCYAFSKALGIADPQLAVLAVIGSTEVPGEPKGLNEEALRDAVNAGLAEVSESKAGVKITVLLGGEKVSRERWSTKLTVLSSVGYYSGGPRMAIDLCLGSPPSGVEEFIAKLEGDRKNVNQQLLSRVRSEGLKKDGSIQWLHVGDAFKGMGTKVIGTFLSYLSFQRRLIDRGMYLVGFMNMSPEIPGLGQLKRSYVKVSARAPDVLASLINDGSRPPLSTLLPEAAKAVGGFGDGHSVAASGIIPKGMEFVFIEKMNLLVGGGKPARSLSLFDFMSK